MINIALDALSIEEKIQMMESLWDSLCTTTSKVTSPSWHSDILAERERAIKEGTAHFDDWENIKEALLNQTK